MPESASPGLVWGVTADNLAPYTKAALQALPRSLPGNRRHPVPHARRIRPEARGDAALLARRLLRHQADPSQSAPRPARQGPARRSDQRRARPRAQGQDQHQILDGADGPALPSHAHQHQNQRNRRHGYADLLRYPQRYRVHWQLWSGGTTRLLLWGDPDYVRRFAATATPLRRRQLRDQRNARHQDAGRAARRKAARHPQPLLPLSTTTSSSATGTSIASGAASPTIPRPPPKSGSTSSPRASDRRRART